MMQWGLLVVGLIMLGLALVTDHSRLTLAALIVLIVGAIVAWRSRRQRANDVR
jgi:hypothetical protein